MMSTKHLTAKPETLVNSAVVCEKLCRRSFRYSAANCESVFNHLTILDLEAPDDAAAVLIFGELIKLDNARYCF